MNFESTLPLGEPELMRVSAFARYLDELRRESGDESLTRLSYLNPSLLQDPAALRALVYAATLIGEGMAPLAACRAALVEALTDDREIAAALMEVVGATFGK